MSEILAAFGPAFAAGFAVQRLLEIVDSWLIHFGEGSIFVRAKPTILATLSLVTGLLLTTVAPLRVLEPLGATNAVWADMLVTALVISAGTEGFNSIVKFLEYAKDNKKGQAALSKATADGTLVTVDPGDTALTRPAHTQPAARGNGTVRSVEERLPS